MFPQSELDNYKLQVELLQEKLQRSEISRQQLEHKLGKILQKRDEHDKLVRSKARQKYQQFLEEQQRRNERNKQLVQMLERIEQQTEIMNARSERLKMMKLQYEMYFAKLVHTQTRRCIQNSVQPMTHFMPVSSNQPAWSAAMEDHNNYMPDVETTTPLEINNSYQRFATPQEANVAMKTSDIPTLAQIARREEKQICIDPKGTNMTASIPPKQLYQCITEESVKSMLDNPANISCNNNQEITNANNTQSSLGYLLANDKKLSEAKDVSNLSTTTTSSTFEEIQNLGLMPQKDEQHTLHELPKTRILNSFNHTSNSNVEIQPLNRRQEVNDILLKSTNETDNVVGCGQNAKDGNESNKKPQDASNAIQAPRTMELKNNDIIMPNQYKKPSQLENSNSVPENLLSFSNNKNVLKKQPASIEQIQNAVLTNNNTETNSSTTSVSIENIENEIYGELLSPLETAEVKSQETSNVVPQLFENLVTQSENIENISSEGSQLQKTGAAVSQQEEYSTAAAVNNTEQYQNLYNYEQNKTNDEFKNTEQSEEPVKNFSDYTSYENVDGAEIDGGQQQYDYTNYDPTQYSYPGYVYDETTGEYKPDPNAPLEQYATDQQYATEGYEQQYQQQNYDYNQTYTAEAAGLSTNNAPNTVDNGYDTSQKESPSPSNVTTADTDVTQQQTIMQPEAPQTVVAAEEVATTATPKVVKPTSILSSADKSETQKKKKRVNFIDSSETDESAAAAADKGAASTSKPANVNSTASSESDFDFSSSIEAEAKDA